MGLTQTGNPELDPEESTSFTAGLVFEPMSNLSFTLDYWNIEVEEPDHRRDGYDAGRRRVLRQQWRGNIPGFTVTPAVPDAAFPNALPLLGFIESSFTNQDKQKVSGIDFGANLSLPIGDTLTLAQLARRFVPRRSSS